MAKLGQGFPKLGHTTINISRVVCPKFRHRTLSSAFYNSALKTEFGAAVGILRIKSRHHSKAKQISKGEEQIPTSE